MQRSELTLEQLGKQFETARDAEHIRFCASQPRIRISAWRPQNTAGWDEVRRSAARDHMRRWSAEWWRARGYRITVTDESNDQIEVEPL